MRWVGEYGKVRPSAALPNGPKTLTAIGCPPSSDMGFIEVLLCSLFYQAALYLAIRLAHQGFTLGELGIVTFGASVLFMEGFNITVARVSL